VKASRYADSLEKQIPRFARNDHSVFFPSGYTSKGQGRTG